VSTYIWKKKAGNIEIEASKENRERKNSGRTSVYKILEVEEGVWKGGVRKNI